MIDEKESSHHEDKKEEKPEEKKAEYHERADDKRQEHKSFEHHEYKTEKKEHEHKPTEHHIEKKEHEHKPAEHHIEKKEHEHKPAEHQHHVYTNKKEKPDNTWKIISGVLLVLLVIAIFTNGFGGCPESDKGTAATGETLSKEDASEKAISFINDNLMQPGMTASVVDVNDAGDSLYKVTLSVQGNEFESFITKDGNMLFPSGVDMTQKITQPTQTEQPAQELEKSDKPEAELFIMSYCPYGTQAAKGMIPVMELLGDKADIKIRFVHYVMHGEEEEIENNRMMCIREEQGDKFVDYMVCFLDAGESEECIEKVKLDKEKLEACMEDAVSDYKTKDSALSQGYGVRGSPTLIVNGATVSSGRSPAAYLSTICSAFNEAPEECQEELSTQTPSPGFGYGEYTGSAGGQC